jgi:putative sterol carrier protein
MGNASSAFFASLAARGQDPVLGSARGTVRVDLLDDGRTRSWLVGMDHGRITVAEGGGDADCVIRTTHEAFDELAEGRTAALAAALRGVLDVEGDPRLLVRFQRLFPAPTGMPPAAGARSAGKRRS